MDPDPALVPLRSAARVQDFRTLRWLGPPPFEGNPDAQDLVSGLSRPIWGGIGAQDPDPALLPRGGAARGQGPKLAPSPWEEALHRREGEGGRGYPENWQKTQVLRMKFSIVENISGPVGII